MSDYLQGDQSSVPFSDDDPEKKTAAEVAEEEDSPTDTPEVRAQRKERRQQRIQKMIRDGQASASKVKELEERDHQRSREIAELRGALQATQQLARANDNAQQRDPWENELDQVYARQQEAYNAAQGEIKAGTFTAERQQHYERIARGIESDKTRIHTERALAQRVPAQRAETAQQMWVNRYPDVYNNPKAFQYAQATWQQRQALGEQPTNSLVEEVMADTMTRFKLGPKPAPTASEKSRHTGVAAGGGGAARGGTISPTPQLRAMAMARYGGEMSEEEAWKKWVSGPGKRLQEKKVI